MIWVTWRQHRVQALMMLGVFAVVAIYALGIGLWMRSTFNSDGLGACLARSGGAHCGAMIGSFFQKFTGGAVIPLILLLFLIPAFLGAVVGAPVLGTELERGTWQLAWSQTVPRGRWLAAKLGLIVAGLVAFGGLLTVILTWAWGPLDEVSVRLMPPPFNFEGIYLPSALLCGFGLALLAGLLLRNTIGAMVAGYFACEVPFVIGVLLVGPARLFATTMTVNCAGAACASASANSTPPVTGHLGDMVTGVTHAGNQLVVSYVPAAPSGRCSSSSAASTWGSRWPPSVPPSGCCTGGPRDAASRDTGVSSGPDIAVTGSAKTATVIAGAAGVAGAVAGILTA